MVVVVVEDRKDGDDDEGNQWMIMNLVVVEGSGETPCFTVVML